MKIDRLLGILTVLLEYDKIRCVDLARRFEVSVRTIHRDIQAIGQAGIPIVAYPGIGGGVGILPTYKLDKRLFSRKEMDAIVAGLQGLGSIGENSQLNILMQKLRPQDPSPPPDSDIIIDFSSWHNSSSLLGRVSELRGAIAAKRLIKLDYTSMSGHGRRLAEPYKIVFKSNSWYLFAFCRRREDFRLFKLSRISGLTILEESFFPRPLPDLALSWEGSRPQGTLYRVALELAPELAHLALDLLGDTEMFPLPGGWVGGVVDTAELDWAESLALSHPAQVRILEPLELRQRLALAGAELLSRYADGPRP